ncbi:MAG: 16S rRNA (guanine(966)-N(2))-methyltransferase RsmD [Syntrophobacteraceae bacterium]
MRIVAGAFRGRRLNPPKGRAVRPTTDRVREAVFSIIATRVPGARVLDLFAGTGAMGLEALSRGAAHAVFVDRSPESIRLIQSNIALCNASERVAVIHDAAQRAIRRLEEQGEKFDIVFLDPPYGERGVDNALLALAPVAGRECLAVAERHIKDELPNRVGKWIMQDERRYGDSLISFFEREGRPELDG